MQKYLVQLGWNVKVDVNTLKDIGVLLPTALRNSECKYSGNIPFNNHTPGNP